MKYIHKYTPPHVFLASKRSGGGSSGCHILAQRWYGTPFHSWHLEVASTRHWREWTCQTAFRAWRSALNSTRPWRDHYKPYFFSWNISRCGGGHPPFLKYVSFYLPPTPPLRGGGYWSTRERLWDVYICWLYWHMMVHIPCIEHLDKFRLCVGTLTNSVVSRCRFGWCWSKKWQ